MQHLSLRSARCGAAPGGPLVTPAAQQRRSSLVGAGVAGARPRNTKPKRWTPGRREARPAQRAGTVIRSGASDGPLGAVPQRAERIEGFCMGPFALVTFIWGRK